eukprot:g5212.t1
MPPKRAKRRKRSDTGAAGSASASRGRKKSRKSNGTSDAASSSSSRLIFDARDEKALFTDPPFAGTVHTLQVYVVAKQGDDESEKPVIGSTIPLEVLVLQSSSGNESEVGSSAGSENVPFANPSLLQVLNGTPEIDKDTGACDLKLKFLKPSHPFQLVVRAKESPKGASPKSKNSASSSPKILAGTTRPLSVVEHKLSIVEPLVETWYKDQGGRDKCLELKIHLKNRAGELVTNRIVPLTITLHYDIVGRPPARPTHRNHTIALLQMTTKCDANCRKGKACIRVRINDVSKNHQSRAFVIKVGPDLAADPTVFNVAATWSTPVSVKSKINTSKKRKNDPKNEKNSELLAAAGYNNSLDTMQAAMRVSHAAASSEGTSQAPASGASGAVMAGSAQTGQNSEEQPIKSVYGIGRNGGVPSMPPRTAASVRSADYHNLDLPLLTPSLTESIRRGTIGPQASAAVIVQWGNCVKTWIEQTYRQMSTFARFNSQVAQPLLQSLLRQAHEGQLGDCSGTNGKMMPPSFSNRGNSVASASAAVAAAAAAAAAAAGAAARAPLPNDALHNLSSPERDAASALIMQSLQPGLALGPSAVGSRQPTDSFLNEMLNVSGGADSENSEVPSLTLQSSLAPLHVQTSLESQPGCSPPGLGSPILTITDAVEKRVSSVQVTDLETGKAGSECPCFDKDGEFLGVYRRAGMSVVFVEVKKLGKLGKIPSKSGYQGLTLEVKNHGNSVGLLKRELIMKVVLPSISASSAAAVIAASPSAKQHSQF